MKTISSLAVLTVFVAFGLSSMPARAHHSFAAEFDASKSLKLTGSVTRVDWQNPHAWFYIDVKGADGKVTNWGFELGSPNGLMRSGWSRNTLKSGDMVTVEASQAKDGSSIGNARTVTLSSTGQRLFAGTSQPGQQQQ
jgi:hypothetical protein